MTPEDSISREPLKPKNPEDLELLTVPELAARLKVPVSWVYHKSRERRPDSIPAVRAGKHLRFFYPEVIAWLRGLQDRRGA